MTNKPSPDKATMDQPAPLAEAELDQVIGAGSGIPSETVSLNYERIKITDAATGADGGANPDGISSTALLAERYT